MSTSGLIPAAAVPRTQRKQDLLTSRDTTKDPDRKDIGRGPGTGALSPGRWGVPPSYTCTCSPTWKLSRSVV
jgi:hypothetical protein